jgi:hypothetical protein
MSRGPGLKSGDMGKLSISKAGTAVTASVFVRPLDGSRAV